MKIKFKFLKSFIEIFTLIIFLNHSEFANAQSVKIESKEVIYKRPHPANEYKDTITVTHPKVVGEDKEITKRIEDALSFEKTWDTTIEKELNESEWLDEAFFEVLYNKNGILSVELMIDGSAAYPNLIHKFVVVDIKTGKKLNSNDVFVNKDQLLDEIIKKQKAEIKDSIEFIKINPEFNEPNPETLFEDKHFTSEDLEQFFVGDKGVTFTFNYSFPHYALALEPMNGYFFSWKELTPFINKKGVFAGFIEADADLPSFQGKTSAECEKLYKKYLDEPDNFSQMVMNAGAYEEMECLKRVMHKTLDLRLLKLKTENPKRFKTEMELQKTFNKAVQAFTEKFDSVCEGSACGVCHPGSSLYKYRTQQSEAINTNSLIVPKIKENRSHSKLIKKSFNKFAEGLCQMPKEVWQNKSVTKNCNEAVLADIKQQLRFYFIDQSNEGDVCSQLPATD